MAGSPIGEASVKVTGETSGFEGALSKITGLAAGAGAKISGHLGGAFTAVAAAAAPAAIVGGLLKIGETFEKASDQIRVQTGATGAQLSGLEGSFKTVFAGVPASSSEAASAIGTLSQKLGLTGAPLEALSKQVLDLSRVTKTDLGGNLQATSDVFNNWGIAAGDQGSKLDELFRASQMTGISVTDLASKMATGGVVFRDVGLNFEQSAALLGTLSKEGIDSSAVMPALSKSMATAAKQGKDAGTLFHETFAKIKDTSISDTQAAGEAMKVFGAKAGPRLSALIREGKLSFDDMAKSIASGGDTIEKASEDTMRFPERMKLFSHQAMLALEPLGTALLKLAGSVLERVGPAIQRLSEWVQAHLVPAVQAAVARLGPLVQQFIQLAESKAAPIIQEIAAKVQELVARLRDVDWASVFAQAKDWIMPVVDALMNVGRAVVDLAGAVAEFIAGHWDQIKSAFETVADIAKGALTTALTVLGGIIRTVADNFSTFGPIILGVVAAIVAYKTALAGVQAVQNIIKTGQQVYNTAIGVYHNLLKVGQVAQKAYTAAQWLLNAAMSANPIALVVIGIAALVAGFILAYKHIKPFHDAVDAIGRVIKEVVTGAIDFFIDHWQLLAALLLGGPIGVAILFIIQHFDTLKNAVTGAVTWILSRLGEFLGFMVSLPGNILSALGDFAGLLLSKGIDLVTGLYNGAVSMIGTVIGWFAGLAGMVLGALVDAASWLISTGVSVVTGLYNGVVSFEGTLLGWFTGLGGKIIGAISDAASWLFSVGEDIVHGLVNGLESGWHWVTDKVSSLANALPGFAKSALGMRSPSKVFAEIGHNITQGLTVGIAQGTSSVAAHMTGLANMVGSTPFGAGLGGVGGGLSMPGGPGGGFRAGGGGSSVNNSRTWQSGAVQINIPAQASPEATAMAVSRRLAMGVAA